MKAATIDTSIASADEIFQSTPPVKAATRSTNSIFRLRQISIHAAREGGDRHGGFYRLHGEFQSTPPVKAATSYDKNNGKACKISIHAAREGGDQYLV